MTRSNPTILPWYTNLNEQHHRRWYAFDQVFPLPVQINQVPPFQLVRGQTGAAITEFKIITFPGGVETDVLSAITTAGLSVQTFPALGYDLIIYPATVILPVSFFSVGRYYCRMQDGANVWYSEIFSMTDNLTDLIRIDYGHSENIDYPGGHIDYENVYYKNHIYIASTIGKPGYPYEERVARREGYNFPFQQISFKRFRFMMLAPEYLADAMRLIRLHDCVTIQAEGETFEVDEFLMGEPAWQDQGDLAALQIEFHTDTVVVVNGRGVTSGSCDPTPGSCVVVDQSCVAKIDEGSAEYTGFYYVDADTGSNVNFVVNDKILIEDTSGKIDVWTFNGSGYDLVTTGAGEIAWDANTDTYYQQPTTALGFMLPVITGYTFSTDPPTLYGFGIPGTVAEVYLLDEDDNEMLVTVDLADNMTVPGIQFPWMEGQIAVKVRFGSAACGIFQETEWKYFEGVNFWLVVETHPLIGTFEVQ